MNKIHVNVKQERIDNGQHSSICSCPISQTINSEKDIEDCSVHSDDGHFTQIKMVEDETPSPILGNPPIKRNFR